MQTTEAPLESFRLSPQQAHLWSLLNGRGQHPFHTRSAIRIEGALEEDALRRALARVVERHEILRTTLKLPVNGEPPRQVPGPGAVDWQPMEDVSALGPREHEARLRERFDELRSRSFDLARGPVLSARLLRLGPLRHVLLVAAPALFADAATMRRLASELAALCGPHRQESAIEPEPLQYADFTEWQYELLDDEETEVGRAYWSGRPLPPRAEAVLPFIRRGPLNGFEPESRSALLAPEKLAAIRSLAITAEVSEATFLLAVWQVLCWRLSGRSDPMVAIALDGRKFEELQAGFGLYSRHLPVPSRLATGLTLRELLAQTARGFQEVRQRQEYFSWGLLEGGGEDDRAEPFFPICFEWDGGERRYAHNGLALEIQRQESYVDRFLVKLLCRPCGPSLGLDVQYDSASIQAVDVRRLLAMFGRLVNGFLARPDAALGEIDLMSAAERQQLLREWNDTDAAVPELCLHELFERRAERTPDAVALTCGSRALSYSRLDLLADRLACRLRSAGVGPEVRVGVLLSRSAELVTGILGILKAGGAYLPLDPGYPKERLAFMIDDSAAPVVVTDSVQAGALPEDASVELCFVDREPEAGAPPRLARPGPGPEPSGLAYVIYTSGSTGRPKGVEVPHSSVARLVREADYADLGPDEVFLLLAPVSFDASTLELWGPLANGGRLAVPLRGKPSLEELGKAVAELRVTTLWLTAGLFHLMVDERLEDLRPLRQLLAGGDALSPSHVGRVLEELPSVRLINGYGPTENTTFTTCHGMGGEVAPVASVAIGRPITSTRIHVLDRWMRPIPAGVAGELFTGGDGLARGYQGRAALTAERFVPDALSGRSGQRLYRTGDLVRHRPGGELEFLGRIDQQVKVRGFRIELGEIEAALHRQAGVEKCAVAVTPGAVAGDKRLVAYVVPEPSGTLAETDIASALAECLPDYMVPSHFAILEALPLNANGKVDRAALSRRPLAAPDRSPGGSLTAPRSPVEELLVSIFSELLGVGDVGIEDDFFRLGGHSLMATRVISRVRQVFRVDLPLRQLFRSPTVAGLAAAITAARRGAEASREDGWEIARRSGEARRPLSFAQERLWFLDQLQPGSTAYNIRRVVRLSGALDLGALQRALTAVVRRHEVLRTTYEPVDGQPWQVVREAAAVALPEVDVAALGDDARLKEASRLVTAEASRSFDLTRDRMLRALVVLLGAEEQILVLTVHHIASDGWSMGILEQEVGELYRALVSGGEALLPELPVQYGDFAAWQRSWLSGPRLTEEVAWWQDLLSDLPPILELPTDRPRPAVRSGRGGVESARFGTGLAESLEQLNRARGVTSFMSLLSAFQVLLGACSGQDRFAVGTPIAGRTRMEVEPLVGFFVNTLVLPGRLSGDPSFASLLARVRETALSVYEHQELPFEKLVEKLAPERSLVHSPLFQVMFAFQNMPHTKGRLEGLSAERIANDGRTAAGFDLSLATSTAGRELTATLEYSRDLFDASTVRRWLAHLKCLVSAATADPDRPVSQLPLLSGAESQQLLREWSGAGSVGEAAPLTVADLFEARVERCAESVALVDRGLRLTYGELNRRANRLAHHLRELGVGPEARVGLLLERSFPQIVGLLGIMKADGCYLPLDPTCPKARLAFLLEDAGVEVLVTDGRSAGSLPDTAARLLRIDRDRRLPAGPAENPERTATPANAAYVIYTSGSTGRPKGVVISHRSFANYALASAEDYELAPGDRALQFYSISFDASAEEIYPTLLAGATLALRGPAMLDSVAGFLASSDADRLTVLNLPTAYWHEVCAALESDGPRLPDSVRLMVIGGEQALSAPLDRWQRRVGARARLINTYGPTEATIGATRWALPEGRRFPNVPIGRPVSNLTAYVLGRKGKPAPAGTPGELYLGGEGLARGYLGHPALTARRFLPDPFGGRAGARLYRTGDLVRWWPAGDLEFLGRADHQVKIRGFRIELGEIELALQQHSGVLQCAVVARERRPGDLRLVAYVVPSEGPPPAHAELRAALARRLPDYMVPSLFATLEAMPLTSSDKVDRKALLRLDLPATRSLEPAAAATPPRDRVELDLLRIWNELLGAELGVRDDFFAAGGHSLLAVRLMARIESRFGVRLPLAALFAGATVEHLAAVLREEKPSAVGASLVPIQPAGERPDLFWVHPVGGNVVCYLDLSRHLGREQPFYGFQAPGLDGREPPLADIEALAGRYVAELRAFKPDGPYLLAGWSMGGLVALEMARRLESDGQEVPFLGLLDTRLAAGGAPTFLERAARRLTGNREDPRRPLIEFGLNLGLSRQDFERSDFDHLDLAEPSGALAALVAEARKQGAVSPDLGLEEIGHLYRVFESHCRAVAGYTPRAHRGPAVLFKAAETGTTNSDPSLGLRSILGDGLRIRSVPGDHFTVLREPHVRALARKVSECVDQLLEKESE